MSKHAQPRLKVAWAYPDILNLHGDRGNVLALRRVCDQLGVRIEVRRVDRLSAPIDFGWANLVLLNPGELTVLPGVIAALRSSAGLADYLSNDRAVLCVGTSGAILGGRNERSDGSAFDGLGVFDFTTRERDAVFGDDLIFEVAGCDPVLGTQIQMIDITLGNAQEPLGKVRYGRGNDAASGVEGARRGNAWFTNAIGPVLVKNPWFAAWVIEHALQVEYADFALPDPLPSWPIERASAQAISTFNDQKPR